MTQIYLTTTGNVGTVVIDDLGAITFEHPTTRRALLIPEGFLRESEVNDSIDLQEAVDRGEIILDDDGVVFSDIRKKLKIPPKLRFNSSEVELSSAYRIADDDFLIRYINPAELNGRVELPSASSLKNNLFILVNVNTIRSFVVELTSESFPVLPGTSVMIHSDGLVWRKIFYFP